MTDINSFVFVVCGDAPYIDSLHTAMESLRPRTQNNILVITDSRRNAKLIQADRVIDIETPDHLNHHQASVFLKTSVHKHVDLSAGRYCYLDSDIVAISDQPDEIFEQPYDIIGFAADNMSMDLFSPYSVNCGCLEKARADEQKLSEAQMTYAAKLSSWEEFVKGKEGEVLMQEIAGMRRKPWSNLMSLVRFSSQKLCPFCKTVRLRKYTFDKAQNAWFNDKGEKILYPIISYFDFVAGETSFKYKRKHAYWFDHVDQDVCVPRCNHLHQLIRKEYGISIHPDQWQHWNGGMFLFDHRSIEFLDYWHSETMRIFGKPGWRTRDQGTLALTAWKFRLNDQTPIDHRFNYIVDDHKHGLMFDDKKGISRDSGASWDRPELLHVYHRFGDEDWEFWQYLLRNYLKKNNE